MFGIELRFLARDTFVSNSSGANEQLRFDGAKRTRHIERLIVDGDLRAEARAGALSGKLVVEQQHTRRVVDPLELFAAHAGKIREDVVGGVIVYAVHVQCFWARLCIDTGQLQLTHALFRGLDRLVGQLLSLLVTQLYVANRFG